MPYAVACPGCAAPLRVPDHAGLKRAECPTCGAAFRIPLNETLDELQEPVGDNAEPVIAAKPKRRRKTLLDYEDEMAPSLRSRKRIRSGGAKKSGRR